MKSKKADFIQYFCKKQSSSTENKTLDFFVLKNHLKSPIVFRKRTIFFHDQPVINLDKKHFIKIRVIISVDCALKIFS